MDYCTLHYIQATTESLQVFTDVCQHSLLSTTIREVSYIPPRCPPRLTSFEEFVANRQVDRINHRRRLSSGPNLFQASATAVSSPGQKFCTTTTEGARAVRSWVEEQLLVARFEYNVYVPEHESYGPGEDDSEGERLVERYSSLPTNMRQLGRSSMRGRVRGRRIALVRASGMWWGWDPRDFWPEQIVGMDLCYAKQHPPAFARLNETSRL